MFVLTPSEGIYHLAKSETFTLCSSYIASTPDNRRRRDDRRLVDEIPMDRVRALCSECASLSGDTCSFSQRIIYPKYKELTKEKATLVQN